jgi:subtilisin family serine protease
MGVVFVTAAGNHHEHAEILRKNGLGKSPIIELLAPGIVDEAITVGAVSKNVPLVRASFSSYGRSTAGNEKPDLTAPGIGVLSTMPIPRTTDGKPQAVPDEDIFESKDGTSMATPMVTAAVAMLIQKRKKAGLAWTPADIKKELLEEYVRPLPKQIGTGRGVLSFHKKIVA